MNLQEQYKKEVIPKMKEVFGYTNNLAVPKIEKVVVNIGIGKHTDNKDMVETIEKYITAITGQKPIPTRARKAIAAFKTREGLHIGFCATLRGKRMYDFLERLIKIALPRSRDFRGLDPKSVDSFGNLTIGIREHIIFPEMIQEDIKHILSFEVTVVTSAKEKKEADELFRLMGFPLRALSKKPSP